MTDVDRRWTQTDIAEQLGFSESAVKKWRGHTLKALRRAGQESSEQPSVLLPTNALPLPSNQREHVRDKVPPRWEPDLIRAWAERTERRHPETKETTHPSPPGRTPDPNRQPRVRRTPTAPADLVAAA